MAKTVIRGGTGIFFDSSEDSETHQMNDFYPWSMRGNYTASVATHTLLNADNSFPALPTTLSPVTPSLLSFLLIQMNQKSDPYLLQWDVSIERQLASRLKGEINYTGNKGTHLMTRQNFNQDYTLNPANPTPPADRVPYPNFGTSLLVDMWGTNSNYNSLNAKLEGTVPGGLTLLAAYTWSKMMDVKSAAAAVDGDVAGWASTLDPHNMARDYARSSYDVGNHFVMSFLYDLPVGKGHALSMHGLNAVIGGWQLNGIATFQYGFPTSCAGTDNSLLNGEVYSQRCNVVGSYLPSGFVQNSAHWFNTAAFVNPPIGVLGNEGRDILRQPGINNWDMSLFKNNKISEKLNVQLRLESFNTFNHLILGGADMGVTSPSFGVINGVRIPSRICQLGLKLIF
jgi:hypothetical protein